MKAPLLPRTPSSCPEQRSGSPHLGWISLGAPVDHLPPHATAARDRRRVSAPRATVARTSSREVPAAAAPAAPPGGGQPSVPEVGLRDAGHPNRSRWAAIRSRVDLNPRGGAAACASGDPRRAGSAPEDDEPAPVVLLRSRVNDRVEGAQRKELPGVGDAEGSHLRTDCPGRSALEPSGRAHHAVMERQRCHEQRDAERTPDEGTAGHRPPGRGSETLAADPVRPKDGFTGLRGGPPSQELAVCEPRWGSLPS